MIGLHARGQIVHIYLGSVVDTHGWTEADVKARISKARLVFLQLVNIWKFKTLSLKTR